MAEQETTWAPKPEDIPQLMAEAEAGNAISQYNLGLCYANGNGVEVDLAETVRWLRKAAEQGMPQAQFNLGMCLSGGVGVEKNIVEGTMWLNSAAQQGRRSCRCRIVDDLLDCRRVRVGAAQESAVGFNNGRGPLCDYLKMRNPKRKGYGKRNVYNMVEFYDAYSSLR